MNREVLSLFSYSHLIVTFCRPWNTGIVIYWFFVQPNHQSGRMATKQWQIFHDENSQYNKHTVSKTNFWAADTTGYLATINSGINRWKEKRILPHVAQHFLVLCFKSVYINNRRYLFMAKKRPPWVTSCSDWSYSPEWLSEWSKHTVHRFFLVHSTFVLLLLSLNMHALL